MKLLRFGLLDSTQSFLARHPELGFCAVMAEAQTHGRGQGENRWESAPGAGLWLSAALPPSSLAPGIVLQRAMEAVIEAIHQTVPSCRLELGLKWPNDLVAWKEGRLVKVGGILGETKGDRMLLGLGVNLNAAPSLPHRVIAPASLRELGVTPAPEPLELARAILAGWADLSTPRRCAFRWPRAGEAIRWDEGEGRCEGWLEDGRLSVRNAEGLVALCGGEVLGFAPIMRDY
ncbi:MAG: hypothetical protein LWX11_04915 [Firmicutes bacterium]|nr:hypothetical protein [Bacillota bacterium]